VADAAALKAMGGSATTEELCRVSTASVSQRCKLVSTATTGKQTELQPRMGEDLSQEVGAIENSARRWSLQNWRQLTPEEVLSVPARVRKQLVDEKRARELASPEGS